MGRFRDSRVAICVSREARSARSAGKSTDDFPQNAQNFPQNSRKISRRQEAVLFCVLCASGAARSARSAGKSTDTPRFGRSPFCVISGKKPETGSRRSGITRRIIGLETLKGQGPRPQREFSSLQNESSNAKKPVLRALRVDYSLTNRKDLFLRVLRARPTVPVVRAGLNRRDPEARHTKAR